MYIYIYIYIYMYTNRGYKSVETNSVSPNSSR